MDKARSSRPRRNALVTGANRGIGRAIVAALAERADIRVVVGARSEEAAGAVAQEVGGGAVPLALDLSQPEAIEARVAAFEAGSGAIDILVNNAGVLVSSGGVDATVPEFLESFLVNTVAPYALARAAGRGMRARGWGRIVNVSSGWGAFAEGLGGPTAYAASKAVLNALTVKLAQALGPAVKVNAACPGWVRTRMGGASASCSPQEGADTPVWLATLPDDGPTGGFFRRRQPVEW